MANRYTYTIWACPVVGKKDAIDLSNTGSDLSTSRDREAQTMTVTLKLNPDYANSKTNKILEYYLCPENEDCSCTYTANVTWDVQNFNVCRPDFNWTNPSANCLLRQVQLRSSRSLAPFVYQSGLGPNEPVNPLYPDGDERNPSCVACGISGDDEEYSAGPNVEPGTGFTLFGYFRDEECGGELTEKSLDETVWFETDGFVGGTIISSSESDGVKTYSVNIKGSIVSIKSVDNYEPGVGEWVNIVKLDCKHDEDDSWPYQLSDSTVCTNPSGYKIVKHSQTGLGC
jgi:hypothetical protein